ncbi:MAG: M1 family metallopeptidase [Kofleriaceae bacterium]|nr:M1 family metallopeptidase [Kofleriaceae bacterium]
MLRLPPIGPTGWIYLVLLLFINCGGNAPTNSTSSPKSITLNPNEPPTARLTDASVPSAARIRIEIDSSSDSFRGKIAIRIDVEQPLHTLWLHNKGLTLESARYETQGLTFPLVERKAPGREELLGLRIADNLSGDIPAGSGTLTIRFSGKFGDMQGLFRQKHKREWYAYTDFEATDARAAFPCYDDPRFKIPWDIELVVPTDQLAFANTPEISRSNWPGAKTRLFQFATTPKLPSYLVAFAAGPFEFIEGKAAGIPLRIIAPIGQAEKGRFVLDTTDHWLRFLESYLDMSMPFRKLDFIAVPRFGGAMENPGLVTFSAGILLTGESASGERLRRAAGVTTHELAHLWFGDSVTPHYWNDLWLNEAFATWLSDKAMADWQPKQAREILRIADKSTAFPIDHSETGRRVREPIKTQEDIRNAFDAITYRKGGAMLTMLEAWLGEDMMQQAVRNYLRSHLGSTVRAQDLIRSVQRTVQRTTKNEHIPGFFDSFLNQTGIPLVSATLECEQQPSLVLKQQRYLPLGASADTSGRRWSLPVCYRYPSNDGRVIRECTMLTEQATRVRLKRSSCPPCVHPNDLESGYYHYKLEPSGYSALYSQGRLDPREQLGFLHSVNASLRSGELELGDALRVLAPMSNSRSPEIQSILIALLYDISRSVVGPEERPGFAALVRDWYGPTLSRLGITRKPAESNNDALLRSELLQLVADLGQDEKLKQRVRDLLSEWLKNQEMIHPILLHSWLVVAAFDGDEALMNQYRSVQSATSIRPYSILLATAQLAFRDPKLFEAALARNLEDGLNGPLLVGILQHAVAHPKLLEIVSKGISSHWTQLLGTKDQASNAERITAIFAHACSEMARDTVASLADKDLRFPHTTTAIVHCMAFAKRHRPAAADTFRSAAPN